MTSRRAVLAGLAGIGLGATSCSTDAPAGSGALTGTLVPPSGTSTASAPPSPSPSAATASPGMPGVLAVDGPDIQRGPATAQAVALTFHGAGDVALTRSALAVLASAGATVTVFAVGQWLAATPQLGRDLVAAGHDLGNHTWSHQTMPSLTLAAAAQEIRRGADAVAGSVGTAGLLFRPSGTPSSTSTIRQAATSAGYHRCVSYDVDPEDFSDPGRDVVVRRTLAGVSPGSIVSLHLGHQGTVDALPAILSGLSAKGLKAVRLTTLLAGAS